GICPGNRLKIIQSHDSGCFTLSPASSPCPTIDSTTNLNSPIPSEIYENTSLCSSTSAGSQRQGKRRSWHIMPNKFLNLGRGILTGLEIWAPLYNITHSSYYKFWVFHSSSQI
uniref:Uncharacterized protein n=1 Tax=Anopheles christyi TaxID=43041 RepID=A0A182K3D8_9DIPT